jgi:hypothetical protein
LIVSFEQIYEIILVLIYSKIIFLGEIKILKIINKFIKVIRNIFKLTIISLIIFYINNNYNIAFTKLCKLKIFLKFKTLRIYYA